jgi:hypothetical protein
MRLSFNSVSDLIFDCLINSSTKLNLLKRSFTTYLTLTCLLIKSPLLAQTDSIKIQMVKTNKPFYFGFPVLFYTPETRVGFGATGVATFNFKKDSIGAQQSRVNLIAVYTQNKQVLLYLPYLLFLKNRTYQCGGEVGYYNFNYLFYGIGNAPYNEEVFFLKYPRIRFSLLRKIKKQFYAGIKYNYDNVTLFNLDTTGSLIKGAIAGSRGGIVSGLGLTGVYDSRDNLFYPSSGSYIEMTGLLSNEFLSSDFNFVKITSDVSKYFHYRKSVFALNCFAVYTNGIVPFYQMGLLGGQNRMRGFYEGRYRDNQLFLLQGEYRQMLYKRFGIALFGNVGQVANQWNQMSTNKWLYTYGAGLRFQLNKTKKINLRIDVATDNKKVLPYFTIGEAF